MVQALGPDHQLCQPIDPELESDPALALDPDRQLCQPIVRERDWQRGLESERELPIGLETRSQASELVTRVHGFQIREPEFRIAWQIARKHLKTDRAI